MTTPARVGRQRRGSRTVEPAAAVPLATSELTRRAAPAAEDVARRAYEHYLGRGSEHGRDQEDWFRAERELKETSALQES